MCPKWEGGIAWDLREMGSALGRGARVGPAPRMQEDKQSTLSEEGGNMEKEEEGRRSWAGCRRTGANRVSIFWTKISINVIVLNIKSKLMLHLF